MSVRFSGMTPASTPATRYIQLSLLAAIVTIGMKLYAWHLTGSVGMLSDALESFVNLGAALFALLMIVIAAAPADAGHPFGHAKAEYFSSGFEGTLIFVAAAAILWTAIPRLWAPLPLESLGTGLWFVAGGTLVNFTVSRVLRRAAHRLRSVALEADASHLMTDVWTSAGVCAGLIGAALTGWLWLDPVIAIAVALHILREGWRLMRGAVEGLMDAALSPQELAIIDQVLDGFRARGASFDRLRTRRAGHERFVDLIVRVPGDWRVDVSHALLDDIEAAIGQALPGTRTLTHLEPVPDAAPDSARIPP